VNTRFFSSANPVFAIATLFAFALPPHNNTNSVPVEWARIMSHMTIVYLDDGHGNQLETIQISGVNVQIVNGLGVTNTTNGLGNLIVGYNEPSGAADRTGSHCIVGGVDNNYSSCGGLVVGRGNSVSAEYASVSGGAYSVASGEASSVSGGLNNLASGEASSVSGGRDNTSGGLITSVSGGNENTANADYSWVGGGFHGMTNGRWSSVTGGYNNITTGQFSSVTGGGGNIANGYQASATGGSANQANGYNSSVSGGFGVSVFDDDDWAAGSCYFCDY